MISTCLIFNTAEITFYWLKNCNYTNLTLRDTCTLTNAKYITQTTI